MRVLLLIVWTLLAGLPAAAKDLDDVVGRTELVVRSAPYAFVVGRSVQEQALAERLARLGYRRVEGEPTEEGTFAVDGRSWQIHRRGHRIASRDLGSMRIVLEVDDKGVVRGLRTPGATPLREGARGVWLEPEVLATSWQADRAREVPVALDDLPDHAWQPLLALEDHRFFEHAGVSGRALARATLANARAGGVSEGGSTLTQQLIKNRDLKPRRSVDRKASEAVRALALEASWTKREILEQYLNSVYYGHVDGVGIYGIGQASRTWFGKDASELALHEAALLAAMVQAPNGMNPVRHPERARERRDKAISRMVELEWLDAATGASARGRPLGVDVHAPSRASTRHLLDRVRQVAEEDAAHRLERKLGFEVDTTVDPWLQQRTLEHTGAWLDTLRRDHRRLRGAPLHAVVVVMDAGTGDVLAYVGGDPGAADDGFDRARRAARQPGSTVKPFILLEAYDSCGSERPIRPSSLLSDKAITLDGWTPRNADGRFGRPLPAHDALVQSRNTPFVRLADHCGTGAVADRMRQAGLDLPDTPSPAFLLGAVETTPLSLLEAHSLFANGGVTSRPRVVSRLGRPNGTRTGGEGEHHRRVASAGPTWLVDQALHDVVDKGTGRRARVRGAEVGGKTGTSSDSRDAWFVGHADGVVTVVWVGLDEGNLGLHGGRGAAPLWALVMADATGVVPGGEPPRPDGVVACRVDPSTGLAPGFGGDKDAVDAWCLRRARPPRNQPWRKDSADGVLR